jgi:hypothetical protein
LISKNSTDTEIYSHHDEKNSYSTKLTLMKVLVELRWKKVIGVVVIANRAVVISTDCKLILAYDMLNNFSLIFKADVFEKII